MAPWLSELARLAELFFADAVAWLLGLTPLEFVRAFWALVFLELPRYAVTNVVVFGLYLAGRLERAPGRAPDMAPPTVAVVVPAYNEQATIAATVRSLLEQDYPRLDIVVVDDGSSDGTPQVIDRLRDRSAGRVRCYRMRERQGKSAALNLGLDVTRGAYVVFMDADSTMDRTAISRLLAHFDDPRVGAVAGDIGVRNQHENLLTRFQAVEYLISLSLARRFKAIVGILTIVAGAIGMFRRDLIERVGRLEPGPGNDSDLTIRVRKLGYQVAFAGAAVCLTTVPSTWRRWLRQRMRWDRSVIRNKMRKHGDVYRTGFASFSLSNYLAFVDTLFFTVALPVLWLVYVFDMVFNYPNEYGFILFGVLIIHVILNALRVLLGMTVTGRDFDWVDLLLVVPLFGFYRLMVRSVRVFAAVQELMFRTSYKDPFAPDKVRENMRVY